MPDNCYHCCRKIQMPEPQPQLNLVKIQIGVYAVQDCFRGRVQENLCAAMSYHQWALQEALNEMCSLEGEGARSLGEADVACFAMWQRSCSLLPLVCEVTLGSPALVLRKSLEMPHDEMPEELTSVAQFSFLWGSCSRITSCHGAVRWHRRGRRLAGDELTSGPAAAASGTVTHHPKPQPLRGLSSFQCDWGPGHGQEGSVSLPLQWAHSRCDRISGCCGCWRRPCRRW